MYVPNVKNDYLYGGIRGDYATSAIIFTGPPNSINFMLFFLNCY